MKEKSIAELDLIVEYLCLIPSMTIGDLKIYKLYGIGKVTTSLFKFDIDWNWLKIIVDKIISDGYEVNITDTYTEIHGTPKRIFYSVSMERTQIRATYKAVIELLTIINKKPNGD